MQGIDLVMDSGNGVILDAFMKARSVLEQHDHALVSVSGGGDSDCLIDLMERVKDGAGCDVTYAWFDTGLEYRATRRHLDYLEKRYGVEILRRRAVKSIPTCVREYGQPFVSKYVSAHIERLQKVGFGWTDEPMAALIERYPEQTSAIRWWCDGWTRIPGKPGWFDIGRFTLLKEFMAENPPWFRISNKCCNFTKKKVAKALHKELGTDLDVVGVRKAEGGQRSVKNKCFYKKEGMADMYHPLFWFSDSDKKQYEGMFGIKHSDCYEVWGFKRTGCVGCPYGRNVFWELDTADAFEPNLTKACRNVFKDAYEYTRMYHEFKESHKNQMRLEF